MRAAIFEGANLPLVIGTIPDPACGAGDVILKVSYSGICGTDLHVTQGDNPFVLPGTVLGHEFSGEVVEAGADVRVLWPKGSLATMVPYRPCMACGGECRLGLGGLCPSKAYVGITLPGGNAEYVRCGAGQLARLADGVDMRIGSLTEPMAVGCHAVRKAGSLFDMTVLIMGAGPVGLAVAAFARLAGAREVIVSDPVSSRTDLAFAMGATATMNPRNEDVIDLCTRVGGGPPDVVFECVGVPGVVAEAIGHVKFFGRVIVVGACFEPDRLNPLVGQSKEVSLQFVLGNTLEDFAFVTRMVAQGRIAPAPMITDQTDFAGFSDSFERLRQPTNQCKVLLCPN